jgi:60 kDa SS-A/Ro ribonucleoprotein
VPQLVDALNDAFYAAFCTVEPSGKRLLLALDVSGSMGSGRVAGSSVTPREAAAALALVTAQRERSWHIVGFTSGAPGEWRGGGSRWAGYASNLLPLDISRGQRLDAVARYTVGLPMGGTDCALPMLYALDKGLSVDAFVVYTDSETWAGEIHPVQALREYRRRTASPPSWRSSAWCRTASASLIRTTPACSTSSASTRRHRRCSPTS